MARFRYVVCDVFTDTPLTGNQLAVFTDARELPEARLQDLARWTSARRSWYR
jgi:trans-2,3-dihydro-3-hydroxyanthranilate isomerase